VEVWINDRLVHRETRAERPSYAEKILLARAYEPKPPVRCEACGAVVRFYSRRFWAGRRICEDCLDVAAAPCYRWRGW
jgi:hypothetical protein